LILPLAADENDGGFILGSTIYDWLGFTEPPEDATIAYTTTSIGIL
jgi:hypothetical protein